MLGYFFTDSPAGVLTWICVKRISWTDGYPCMSGEGTFNVAHWKSMPQC